MAALAVSFCSLTADSLYADEPAPELLLFEEVVSAASKREQPARTAPAQTTIITADDIRRFGYRSLADVLRSVRGFYGSSDRNYDYLGVRGFLRPTDYNDRILLLVNGHTYNDDIYQQALVDDSFGVDLEAIERIEVVRGPGAALYGGNALFAVINVVTATAVDRPAVHALAEGGSYNRNRVQIGGGHLFANGADVYISASALRQDGDQAIFFPELDDADTNHGVAENLDGLIALSSFAIARWGDWTVHASANRREKEIPTAPFGTLFNQPGNETIDERAFVEVQYQRPLLADLTLQGRAYGDRYYYAGDYPYEGDEPGSIVSNRDFAESYWAGGELSARWEVPEWSVLTVGGEYSYHPDARQRNYDLGGESYLDDSRSFGIWGVYIQEEVRLPADVTLVGGARYDDSYHGVHQANPRLAAIWAPVPTTTLKLLYGQAFRPPNLYELYYAVPGEGGSVGNLELDPESITTYELALEQGLLDRIEARLALFHYEIDRLVDSVEGDDGLFQFRNIGSAHADGIEVGIDALVTSGLRVRGSYSYQDAEGPGGRRLTNSPRHLGVVGLLLPEIYGLELAAELRVISPRKTLAGNELETVTHASINAIYNTPIPGLALSAAIYNLFDQSYGDPGGAEHVQDRIPQDRLTFRAQLRYGF